MTSSSAGAALSVSGNSAEIPVNEPADVGSSTAGVSTGISNSEISHSLGVAGSGVSGGGGAALLGGGAAGLAGGALLGALCSRSDAHSSDKSTSCTGGAGAADFCGGGGGGGATSAIEASSTGTGSSCSGSSSSTASSAATDT